MGFYTIYCTECGTPEHQHGSTLDKRCESCRTLRPKTDAELLREYRSHCSRIQIKVITKKDRDSKRFRTDVDF